MLSVIVYKYEVYIVNERGKNAMRGEEKNWYLFQVFKMYAFLGVFMIEIYRMWVN